MPFIYVTFSENTRDHTRQFMFSLLLSILTYSQTFWWICAC